MALPNDHLLTVRELAFAWQTTDWMIYELIRRGELKAVKVGRSTRIRPTDARAYIEAEKDRMGRVTEPEPAS
jgi:excisionase family DNA binding protein